MTGTLLRAVAEEGVPLAPLTTYKMGGPARYLAQPDSLDRISELARLLAEGPDLPVLVLGRGSNVVISEAGFEGLVVRLGKPFLEVRVGGALVEAGGGAPLPVVARTAARAGRGGLEFFVGIPGSVGGAVRMNAGCHGSETVEWLDSARVVDLRGGGMTERGPLELALTYRESNLLPHELVVSARFRSVSTDPDRSEAVIREITRWRRDNQPGGTHNAGSVFRNPPGDAAGRVIDMQGLKGFRVGGASVSEKHANFFVAQPESSPQDVYDLVWAVRRRVGEATGVWLVPEIQFAGPFRSSADEAAGP